MSTSGDSLLISLFAIIIPAIVIFIGTLSYSRILIGKYKNVLSRLYRSSFRGADTERKRIASELHNQLAIYHINISKGIEILTPKLTGSELQELLNINNNFQKLKEEIHQIIQYMYPQELTNSDWESSFKKLALHLTSADIQISFECETKQFPKSQFLPHTYWVVQEIVTNAIKHSKAKRVQLSALSEEGYFFFCICYRATENTKSWLENKSAKSAGGMGRKIIADRLNIINSREKIEVKDNIVTHLIKIPLESSNH